MLVELSGNVLCFRGMEPFSETLKRLRGILVSQQELAEKTGMTVSTISKLERGTNQPSRKTIVRLAAALNVPEQEMLKMVGLDNAASPKVAVRLDRKLYEQATSYAKAHELTTEEWITAAIQALMRLQGPAEQIKEGQHIAGRIDGGRHDGAPGHRLAGKPKKPKGK